LGAWSRLNRDSPDLAELRGRIVQIFFKHLTSSNDVAVAMSQDGLTAAIAHHKMPKTLLQARAGSAPHALHALLPIWHMRNEGCSRNAFPLLVR
jgi:hypothetical protein